MTDTERYLFDVHGYLVIEGVLGSAEVEAANAAIDRHRDEISIRRNDLANGSRTLKGETGRGDLHGMLAWPSADAEPFRRLIAHRSLLPYLEELLGDGLRLDQLGTIIMRKGAEGFWFHEGGEPYDRSRGYLHRSGRIYCGLTNVAVQLTDVGPEDGGFACVPGSHKANFPCPDEIRLYHQHQERFTQIPARAGDAILFVETLMHGALPWRATRERRTVMCRYLPGVMAETTWGSYRPPPFYDQLTPEEQALLSPPEYRKNDKGSKLYETG